MPVFEHLRIPFLCGISDPSDFPREEDFGFTLADLGWRTAPPSQSRILRLQDEDRTMVSGENILPNLLRYFRYELMVPIFCRLAA